MDFSLWDASDGPLAPGVLSRLQRGEGLRQVALQAGLSPRRLIGLIAYDVLNDGSCGPSLVQETPRRPELAGVLSEASLAELFPSSGRAARCCLVAGLLQIHDLWDASHEAAQRAEDLGDTTLSAWWHGIAHRREPDPGNASYWFRRVGRHSLYPALGSAIHKELKDQPTLASRLAPNGVWDPFASVTDSSRPHGRDDALARTVQRIEMRTVLAASLTPDFA
jgi:hypothetical protein